MGDVIFVGDQMKAGNFFIDENLGVKHCILCTIDTRAPCAYVIALNKRKRFDILLL